MEEKNKKAIDKYPGVWYTIVNLRKVVPNMVTRIGKAKDDMTKEEFIFWLKQIRKKSFGEVLCEIADFYRVAHDVEKRMIESVMLTEVFEDLFSEEDQR